MKSTKNGYSKSPLILLLPDLRYPGLNPEPSDYYAGCVLLLLLLVAVVVV